MEEARVIVYSCVKHGLVLHILFQCKQHEGPRHFAMCDFSIIKINQTPLRIVFSATRFKLFLCGAQTCTFGLTLHRNPVIIYKQYIHLQKQKFQHGNVANLPMTAGPQSVKVYHPFCIFISHIDV